MTRATCATASVLCVLCSLGVLCAPGARTSPGPDAAYQKFWSAKNPADAARAVQDVVNSGVTFADALARFKRGRVYAMPATRGTVQLQRRSVLGDFSYEVVVPEHYDPAQQYQVRVQLHGGVMMRETGAPRGRGGRGGRGGGPLEGAEQIYVLPTAWREAPWWSRAQLENLDTILDAVKRAYNVAENRVALSGVSDGAPGLYSGARRATAPCATFLPLNGFRMVVANNQLMIDSGLFPTNLLNKPFFI